MVTTSNVENNKERSEVRKTYQLRSLPYVACLHSSKSVQKFVNLSATQSTICCLLALIKERLEGRENVQLRSLA